jgi:Holliday junction resolvase RusA-like endonuclease
MIRLQVYGTPGPQGSKRHVGNGRMIESSKKVKPWRQDVKAAAEAFIATLPTWANIAPPAKAFRIIPTGEISCLSLPLDVPLRLRMVFTLPKPKSAPKRRRTWPSAKPDVSKLARSTEDALVDAGLLRDDARIVDYARLAKVFPGEDPEALASPGVWIEIEVMA